MTTAKLLLAGFGVVALVAGGACLIAYWPMHSAVSYMQTTPSIMSDKKASATLKDNQKPISFEVVSTAAAMQRGLGGRASIPDNYGMLFVFPANTSPGFWMKDMLAPIDMVWIDADGTIASITPDVLPSTYPRVFYPPHPIRYVLETQVGLAIKKGWTAGSRIPLPSSLLPSPK
jgi:uncharacterized membrane protein (UPF0127 family)